MHVLGLANTPEADVEPLQMHATTGPGLREPQISCARAATIQIIMFERPLPNRMQYISLDPISLALGDQAEKTVHAPGSVDAEEEKEEMRNKERKRALVEKLKLHTVIKHPRSQKELALSRIVNQINCSWELHKLLQQNISLVGTRSRRSLSVSERVVESATSMRDFVVMAILQLITVYIYPTVRRAFIIGLLGHRVAAEALLLVLEWRARPDYAALKDISATAQQVEIRLQQFCYWPMQYVTLRKRKDDWESVTTSHADYIRFYNSLWLVANDVIIGIALGSYIIDNSAWVAESISGVLSTYSIAALQRTISWLMDWPAGLKLNNELAAFLGDLFLWVIDHWSSAYNPLLIDKFSDSLRLYRNSASRSTSPHLVHRILKLCGCQYADCRLLGSRLDIDHTHIFVLHGLSPNLQLAVYHTHLPIPTLSRKEAQCAPETN
jgi:phosphatidylinositol glycan class Q protein